MESEGPDNHSGKDEADDEATILRFPRDWFGPPEELVPFGPRAAVPDRSALQPAPDDEPDPAETFWTEGSAAVHDAVQGTESIEVGQEVAPGSRRRGRRAVIAAGAVALAVVVATTVLLGGEGRPVRSGRSSAAIHTRIWTAVSHPPAPIRPVRIAPRRVPASRPSPETKPVVTETASAQSPPPAAAGSPPAQATPSSGNSEAAQSGGSSQPSASAASAQSSSQPAFGASGALGPGHSPNS